MSRLPLSSPKTAARRDPSAGWGVSLFATGTCREKCAQTQQNRDQLERFGFLGLLVSLEPHLFNIELQDVIFLLKYSASNTGISQSKITIDVCYCVCVSISVEFCSSTTRHWLTFPSIKRHHQKRAGECQPRPPARLPFSARRRFPPSS